MTADVELQRKSRISSTKTSFNWERLLRKFSEGRKLECKNVPKVLPTAKREIKYFPTGSSYEGTWNILGMSGHGVYTFPNGTKYQGEFHDGDFHGQGKMFYTNGCVIHGTWKHGELVERKLVFANGLAYNEHDWQYCKMPDRRFHVEHTSGIPAARESHLTAKKPIRDIPLGMFDAGDGFFDPKSTMIHYYHDYEQVIRGPDKPERNWIMKTNRVNPMTHIGPRPDLYEQWQQLYCTKVEPPKQNLIKSSRSSLIDGKEVLLESDFLQPKLSVDHTDTVSENVYCSLSSSSDMSVSSLEPDQCMYQSSSDELKLDSIKKPALQALHCQYKLSSGMCEVEANQSSAYIGNVKLEALASVHQFKNGLTTAMSAINSREHSKAISDARTSSGDVKSSFNWERLLRKFSQGHKVEHKLHQHKNLPLMERSIKHFPTGSSYEGTWSVLGMSGYGVYTFPDGVKFEGEFVDGEFHGDGKMTYPNGCVLIGKWENGELQQKRLSFSNGLKFEEENWKYGQMPDRRYTTEFDINLKPAGESRLSAEDPLRDIPLGMYDTGYGFFDPSTTLVSAYNDLSKAIRGPTKEEQEVIKNTCRCHPIRPLGPRQDLYEEWQKPLIDLQDTDGRWTKRTGSDPNRRSGPEEPPHAIERCKKRTLEQIIMESRSSSFEGDSNLSKILLEDSDSSSTLESLETSENIQLMAMKIKEEGLFKAFY